MTFRLTARRSTAELKDQGLAFGFLISDLNQNKYGVRGLLLRLYATASLRGTLYAAIGAVLM